MADLPQRLPHVRRAARYAKIAAIAGFCALVLDGFYAVKGEPDQKFVMVLCAIGLPALAVLIGAGLCMLWSLLDVMLKMEATIFRSYDVLRDVQSSLHTHDRMLGEISENARLSDMALAITNRGRERSALRLAINEEIIRGDWEAAYALVEQLEARHGYKNEAARLREEVDLSRGRETSEKVHLSTERITRLIDGQDWDRSRRELDTALAASPNSHEVRELFKLFARRRGEHKRRLLKEWDESVQRNEVDRGISILKELDQYLTPNEAAALAESARGVFRAKLHNLGVQFSLAVTEGNWPEALSVGKSIIDEFPNSRMAREVHDRMHVLAKRAGEPSEEEHSTLASQE